MTDFKKGHREINEHTEYIYVYFKSSNMLLMSQSKMAAVKIANNIFETFENSS